MPARLPRSFDRLVYYLKGFVPYGIYRSRHAKEDRLVQAARQKALLDQLVPPGALVFDIGANLGNRIEGFLGRGARVVAVEPHPDCGARLEKIYGDRITLVRAAAGASPGRLPLHIGKMSHLSSLSTDYIARARESKRFGDHAWPHTVEVEVTTLDRLVAAHGLPAFVKIDVEGFELEVLQGLSQPVAALSFEWTPDVPESALRCIDYLAGLGMRHFQFTFGESAVFSHRRSLDVEAAKNLVRMLGEAVSIFGDIYASREPLRRE